MSVLTPGRDQREQDDPARVSTGSRPGRGVLLVKKLELIVQSWMPLPELDRFFEEELRDNGEELRRIGGPVLVEERSPMMLEI